MNIWIIMIVIMVLSLLVQQMLQSRFNKYSQVPTANGMTGAEVAQKMLNDHGIYDVKGVPTRGMLTDHFNPQTKTVTYNAPSGLNDDTVMATMFALYGFNEYKTTGIYSLGSGSLRRKR